METVKFEAIRNLSYREVWNYQQRLHDELKSKKLSAEKPLERVEHHLLFCEHSHVYTLGKSGSLDHLLLSETQLQGSGVEFFKINRGGDITYHGPGQITAYPIFDLERFFTDVHKYVRFLEESVINTLKEFNIEGFRIPKYTGVWVGDSTQSRKICAIGVHLSRWVTMHGLAFNVNTDLSYFENIIPCGIMEENLKVTSMEEELGLKIDMKTVESVLRLELAKLFNYQYL